MEGYDKISECGKYGYKSHEEGRGGQLWAWINTEYADSVGEIMYEENFEIAIDEFELELNCIRAELMNCV